MGEVQTQLFNQNQVTSGLGELNVEVLPPFQGVIGRQADVVVAPPISANEWDTLTQSNPILSKVSHVFEGQNFTRFRLLGEAVDTREEFGIELKQGLIAIRGIDVISGEKQISHDVAPNRDKEEMSLARYIEQLKQVCLEEYAKKSQTVEIFCA